MTSSDRVRKAIDVTLDTYIDAEAPLDPLKEALCSQIDVIINELKAAHTAEIERLKTKAPAGVPAPAPAPAPAAKLKLKARAKPALKKYYLVVNCNYTNRLVQYMDEMDPKPIIIYDTLNDCGPHAAYYNANESEIKLFTSELKTRDGSPLDGIIVFGSNEKLNRLNICTMLEQFKHCACFSCHSEPDPADDHPLPPITEDDLDKEDAAQHYSCGTLYEVEHITRDQTSITVMSFDTEGSMPE